MKQQYSMIASVLAVAFLASCGGGGDSTSGGTDSGGTTPPAVADKYVGTWMGCFPQGTSSEKEVLTLAKTGDTTGTFSDTNNHYASADCSGTATSTDTSSGTFALTGTKTIGADTVDKALITEGTTVTKQVLLVKGTAPVTFTSGRDANNGGVLDADGYPTTLDSGSLTRQ